MKTITKIFKNLKQEIQDIQEQLDEEKLYFSRFKNADNDKEISEALEKLSKGDKNKTSYIKDHWSKTQKIIVESRLNRLFELQLQLTSIKIARITIILNKLETRSFNGSYAYYMQKSLEKEYEKLSDLVLSRNLSLDERLKLF